MEPKGDNTGWQCMERASDSFLRILAPMVAEPRADVAVLILGAGFLVEAGPLVGPILIEHSMNGPYKLERRYPLVRDLVTTCYPDRDPKTCESIELWFEESIGKKDSAPLRRLIEELLRSDYYLVPALVGKDKIRDTAYSPFF